MAYSAKHFTLFLLISLLSTFHSHARDIQFFDKVPSTTTTTNVVKETQVPNKEDPLSYQEQEPNFLPQNENGYSLYGHESGQLPQSTTTATPVTTTTKIPYNTESEKPLNKYLPKNYNPVAYVTEPEDIHNSNSFTEESYSTRTSNNYNYDGGDSFNERPQELSATKFTGRGSYSTTPNNRENFYNNFGPQGMSDTRILKNGKFFYDVNSEKYSSNHPYESLKGVRAVVPYNTESEKPLNKYLPKNYNPVAYVTEPEDIHNSNSFTEESYSTRTSNNYNYDGGDSFNERPQELSATKFTGRGSYSTTPNNRENFYNNFGPQGMSDTRILKNGKFFYDVNSEKYSSNHPYESLKGVRARNEYNNMNIYGKNENSYENNNKYSMEGQYQNEFQDEEDMP